VHNAVGGSDLRRMKCFLKNGLDANMVIDGEQNSPLHLAAERCSLPMVKLVLKYGGRKSIPNVHNDTPEIIAKARCSGRNPELIKVLDAAKQ
jgi:hypothetical protein